MPALGKRSIFTLLIICLWLSTMAWAESSPSTTLTSSTDIRLDQIQIIGTHNSYHAGLSYNRLAQIALSDPKLSRWLDYSHASLRHQFDAGIRQIELDIYADTYGRRFAFPHPPGHPEISWPLRPSVRAVMREPGFKVMHIPDLDQEATCRTLTSCLTEIRVWSDTHPWHTPIFVILETEQNNIISGGTPVEIFTSKTFDALDTVIRNVFPREKLLTPDDVHAPDVTLGSAVRQHGWPRLRDTRGKIVFLLDQRSDEPVYTRGHPGLRGRIAFPNALPGSDNAAFTEMNDGPADKVRAAVRSHLLVRIRADVNTQEGRTGDITRRDTFLASGAQLISTDYPDSEPARWSGYRTGFLSGSALRCNPVTGPTPCYDTALEPAEAADFRLERLIIIMRHGIRSALSGQQPPAAIRPILWPTWAERAGDLTRNGSRALAASGRSLRLWLSQNGIFPLDHCPALGSIVLYANSEPRTIASAQALARGLSPACSITQQHRPEFETDPLFSPLQTDPSLVDMKHLITTLPDPDTAFSKQNNALTLLGRLLHCSAQSCSFLRARSQVAADDTGHGLILSGPINEGSSYAEVLELGFLDGKLLPSDRGRSVDTTMIRTLSGLHAAMLDSLIRTSPFALPLSRSLRARIARDFGEQYGPRLKVYMGHDDTIASLLGAFGIQIMAPGYAPGEIPVGSALGVALYRSSDGHTAAKILFFSQAPGVVRQHPDNAQLSISIPHLAFCQEMEGFCSMRELNALLNR